LGVVLTMGRGGSAGRREAAKPRLRFDKVALRFVAAVQAGLHASVPDEKAVMFTVTAPIRLASKTAAALEEQIRLLLARRPVQTRFGGIINGNQIRIRVVSRRLKTTAKVAGFVHNPEVDGEAVLDTAVDASP
jgi:hypothetical protein